MTNEKNNYGQRAKQNITNEICTTRESNSDLQHVIYQKHNIRILAFKSCTQQTKIIHKNTQDLVDSESIIILINLHHCLTNIMQIRFHSRKNRQINSEISNKMGKKTPKIMIMQLQQHMKHQTKQAKVSIINFLHISNNT